MKAEDKSLDAIFVGTLQIQVPLFQRPYVWEQETNWEPLWEAIKTVADRRLTEDKIRPHFLGAIVLEQKRSRTGEVGTRQVIDGQQRLTTLQIVIAAIRDLCSERGLDNYHEAFKRISVNQIFSKNKDSIFKVWPTNIDREEFRNVMTAGSLDNLRTIYGVNHGAKYIWTQSKIPNCYIYFHKQVTEWLEEEKSGSIEERLESLRSAIHEDIVLVVVDLDDKDDPQLIFETLNAFGTPLRPADLVKNFLFHRAKQEGASIEDLYEDIWKQFDDEASYWRKEVKQGRLKWLRLDLFLSHYLTLQRKSVVSMKHLFADYRDYFNRKTETSAEKHIHRLRSYASVYHGFDTHSVDSKEGSFFHRIDALDTSVIYPVLLELFSRPEGEDRELFLTYLESYLVRRAVGRHTTKGYNRMFVSLIKHLSSTSYSASELSDFLLGQESDSGFWPTDDAFRSSFSNQPVYQMKKARLRMLLEAIEQELRNRRSEKIELKEKLTIEHIMPQSWAKHWTLPEDATPEEIEERKQLVDRFGNLTLVTQPLNSSVSNAPWDTKKQGLMANSALALNRGLQPYEEWNEETIAQRGEEMFKLARKIWPRPSR